MARKPHSPPKCVAMLAGSRPGTMRRPNRVLRHEVIVGVIGVHVPGRADEQRHVPFGERPRERHASAHCKAVGILELMRGRGMRCSPRRPLASSREFDQHLLRPLCDRETSRRRFGFSPAENGASAAPKVDPPFADPAHGQGKSRVKSGSTLV